MNPLKDAYEQIVLALCVWREARGASFLAQCAVAWVIRNRARDKRWPSDVVSVILQPVQFSSFNRSDVNSTKWPKPFDPSWRSCCDAALASIPDPTLGANHYESIPDPAKRPAWCDPHKITTEIGPFRFYKL